MQHIYHLSRETTETITRRLLRPKGIRKKFEGASPRQRKRALRSKRHCCVSGTNVIMPRNEVRPVRKNILFKYQVSNHSHKVVSPDNHKSREQPLEALKLVTFKDWPPISGMVHSSKWFRLRSRGNCCIESVPRVF